MYSYAHMQSYMLPFPLPVIKGASQEVFEEKGNKNQRAEDLVIGLLEVWNNKLCPKEGNNDLSTWEAEERLLV